VQITSIGGRNINDLPLPPKVRGRYVPIRPTPFNDLLPGVQLRLAGNAGLRKDSYVNIERTYTLRLSELELYDRKRAVTDFRLDSASISWLRQQASVEFPLPSAVQIERATSTSQFPSSHGPIKPAPKKLPTSNYTAQPVPQYSAVSIPRSTPATTTPLLPQYTTTAPSAGSQTAITARIAQLPQRIRYREITELPPSPRPRNGTEFVVHGVGILILLAVAVLVVFGTTRWALSGSALHFQPMSAHNAPVKPLALRILGRRMPQAV
jgi:hypothetical protein